MDKDTILVALSVFGWIATFCRALGMWVKNPTLIKMYTTFGNVGWLVVGIIQWRCLQMSMTLFVSNFICVGVYLYSLYKSKKGDGGEVARPSTDLFTVDHKIMSNRDKLRAFVDAINGLPMSEFTDVKVLNKNDGYKGVRFVYGGDVYQAAVSCDEQNTHKTTLTKNYTSTIALYGDNHTDIYEMYEDMVKQFSSVSDDPRAFVFGKWGI